MHIEDQQANQDVTGGWVGGAHSSFLYFLFCILENLGDLKKIIPNSIFCKFSISERSCAPWGACRPEPQPRTCVAVCAGGRGRMCARVYNVELALCQTQIPALRIWQLGVCLGPARAASVSFGVLQVQFQEKDAWML